MWVLLLCGRGIVTRAQNYDQFNAIGSAIELDLDATFLPSLNVETDLPLGASFTYGLSFGPLGKARKIVINPGGEITVDPFSSPGDYPTVVLDGKVYQRYDVLAVVTQLGFEVEVELIVEPATYTGPFGNSWSIRGFNPEPIVGQVFLSLPWKLY